LLNLPFSSPTFGSAVAIVALLAWRLIFHVMPALGMFRSSEGGDDACAIRREGGAPNRSVVAAQAKIFIAGSMALFLPKANIRGLGLRQTSVS
jgi:hypothetical protein